jgi:hypothetical protein
MRQRFYGINFLVTALAALALGGPARAGQEVPFKGRSSGTVTITSINLAEGTAGVIHTHLIGVGQATHLGQFSVESFVDIDLATDTPTGNWVLTAANGDQLFASFIGYPNGGNFTIQGGTGRFQGASGEYVQVIAFALAPPWPVGSRISYTDLITGWITLPRSNGNGAALEPRRF